MITHRNDSTCGKKVELGRSPDIDDLAAASPEVDITYSYMC